MTPADIVLTVICNGSPVCVLNLALPTAKGVGEDLFKAVRDYERMSEQTIQAIGTVAATMQRAHEGSHGGPSDTSAQ